MDDARIKQIMDRVVVPDSICYHKFVPHSFATTSYDSHGYFTFEIAFKIDMVIRAHLNDERYADYYRWLAYAAFQRGNELEEEALHDKHTRS